MAPRRALGGRWAAFAARAGRPVDGASLGVYRALLGLTLAVAHLRVVTEGWIEPFYVAPKLRFAYWGLEAVAPLSGPAMTALHLGLCGVGVLLALGWRARLMAALMALGTAYTDAVDLTNYLNHHWLAILLCALLAALPVIPASTARGRGGATVPAWALWLLRAQVGLVYFYAAVAKMGPDWLLYGQPLNTWLVARADWPLLGGLFAYRETAVAMSWAGMLYDLTIPLWLLWPRTRRAAFAVVLLFHGATALLFRIGIFPWLMTANATLFFAPDWPRRLWAQIVGVGVAPPAAAGERAAEGGRGAAALTRWRAGLAGAYLLVQLALPLRFALYPGEVLWAEEGMRFSWRVMVREKHGDVTLRVRLRDGREVIELPSRWLDSRQEREMASQPDLILQLAHRVAADYRARGHDGVEVYADAWVSLNGRPPRRLVDPAVDLAAERDSFAAKRWISPAPGGPPAQVGLVASWRGAGAGRGGER
jgi:vitamin K-dependent gamma-carboxylase